VPNSQNAALLYLRAFHLYPKDRSASKLLSDFISLEGARANALVPKVQAVLQKYGKALDLVRRAASMPKCRFPMNWQTTDRFPYYADLRELARATAAHAKLCALSGRPHEAATDLQAGFRMAKHIGEDPTLISVLVEYACIGIASRAFLSVLETAPPSEKDCEKLNRTLASWPYPCGHRRVRQAGRHLEAPASAVGDYHPAEHRGCSLKQALCWRTFHKPCSTWLTANA
jgi:hypothetical protein